VFRGLSVAQPEVRARNRARQTNQAETNLKPVILVDEAVMAASILFSKPGNLVVSLINI
jgi:hypothetical protein